MGRDDAIRSAAAELFHLRGFSAVGVDEIGARAGVSGPAIYRHFSGKDEILAELFEQGMDDIVRVTGRRFDDPHEELLHMAREHARHVLSDLQLAGVWTREHRSLVEPHRGRYQRRARSYLERWRTCIARCYPEAPEPWVTIAAHATLGTLNSLPAWPPAATRANELPRQVAAHVVSALRWLEADAG